MLIFCARTKGKTLEQMDTIFGDQLVPHALQDPIAAEAAMSKMEETENPVTVHKENED